MPESTVVTPEVVGPRPRSSVLATLSLIFGVGAALSVLSGVLAGPGIALGIVAAFLGIGGIAATSRRHVAGKRTRCSASRSAWPRSWSGPSP